MLDVSRLEDWQLRDVEHLAALHSQQDPRTIAEMIAADVSYDVVVETAEWDREGTSVSFDGGVCAYLKGPRVKVGDTVTFYDGHDRLTLGGLRHGWALNGKIIEWKTEWERFADRVAMLAEHDRGRRKHYEEARAKLAEWIDQLEGPYRARIDRFREREPDFDVQHGTYEVYPVLMAQRIEAWCRENDCTVAAFRELEHAEQGKIVHAGQPDEYGISGHQFDSACGTARAVMDGAAV